MSLKDLLTKKVSSRKAEDAIGLDIGNFSVKVSCIKKQAERFVLSGASYVQIASKEKASVVDAIKKAAAEAKVTGKKVNASVFSEGVVVRYLLLPEMSADELRNAMNFEIERYVPFKKEEVVSDYVILREEAEKKHIKVLLVAAKKEFVDSRAEIIREAGFEPNVITIDSLVIKNCFQVNYPEKKDTTVALLDIGSKVTNINIIRNNFSYFMRDVQIGGDSLTYLLQEKLEISEQEAEKMKCGLTQKNEEVSSIIEPVLGNLLNEIYLSFDYYESEFGLVVDEIYISGGTSNLVFLSDFLSQNLGREITRLNPLKAIALEPHLDSERIKALSSFLPVSVGLAVESFV